MHAERERLTGGVHPPLGEANKDSSAECSPSRKWSLVKNWIGF